MNKASNTEESNAPTNHVVSIPISDCRNLTVMMQELTRKLTADQDAVLHALYCNSSVLTLATLMADTTLEILALQPMDEPNAAAVDIVKQSREIVIDLSHKNEDAFKRSASEVQELRRKVQGLTERLMQILETIDKGSSDEQHPPI